MTRIPIACTRYGYSTTQSPLVRNEVVANSLLLQVLRVLGELSGPAALHGCNASGSERPIHVDPQLIEVELRRLNWVAPALQPLEP